MFIISGVRLYREGLERLLRGDSRLDVTGTAADVQGALDHLIELERRPDAVLLDIPAPAGLQAPGQLESALPDTRIVALNVPATGVIAWAEADLSGLLDAAADVDEIVQAVETTTPGGTVCSAALAAVLLERAARAHRPIVTARIAHERDVADLMEQGASNQEIAERLQIGLPEVQNHVHKVLTKRRAARRGQPAV